MICELFPFQKQAVNEMRLRVAMALNNYRMLKIPQVVSLQAPTGSGKTIIMSALIEDIFYGSEQFTEQPEAIFVWLSDSPQLNEQSKQKIELKADKVRMDQCVVISDESFDREILEDGHIYFLNTQKLGKAGNLSRHSDTRQYTIWETIENTAREKADRLYFIIDEAHRGMQGRQAGTATTIMQRFIKGSSSGENMAIHAGANIAMAVDNFKNRGYASLGGVILNRRNVPGEEEKVRELAEDFHTRVVGTLSRSELVLEAENRGKTLLEAYPDCEMAEEYRTLAEQILSACREEGSC